MTKCQRIVPGAVMLMLLWSGSAFALGPALFFSDLESGPKTGGQNNKGAFVTLYGANFGTTQGSSTVTVGGGAVDHCLVWGAAWLWYQKITCQLGANAASGNIVVTVAGQSSNGLPFTVRPGNIYFVDATAAGSDHNDGSVAHPWQSIVFAKNHLANGDIAYLRSTGNGAWIGTDPGDGASSLFMSNNSGTAAAPKAILGYPGETATIACVPPSSICYGIRSTSGPSSYWTFGELNLGANGNTQYIVDYENGNGGDGVRWVGNKIHGAKGTNVVLQGSMNGSYFLGNDDYNYWSIPHGAGTNERGYGIYYGGYGTQQNLFVEWNRFNQDQPASNPPSTALNAVVISTPGQGYSPDDIVSIAGRGATARILTAPGGVPGSIALVNPGTGYNVEQNLATSGGHGKGLTVNVAVAGAYGTKGIQIYAHHDHDEFRNITIASNQFWNNCREAISLGGSDGTTATYKNDNTQYIYNNLFVNNGGCDPVDGYSAIQLGDQYVTGNFQIFNNTFFHNGNNPKDLSGDILNLGVNSLSIRNNLFYAPIPGRYCGYVCIGANGKVDQVSGGRNLFFNAGNGPAWSGSSISGQDPKFIAPNTNPSSANFQLQPTSPAKNAGTTVAPATRDIAGTPRPQGTSSDIGVYESAEQQ